MIKKIRMQEEKTKKQRKNQIIIGVVLVALMVFSTAGYSFMNKEDGQNGENEVIENGFSFIRSGEVWKLSLSSQDFYFTYLPSEVKNVSMLGNFSFDRYAGKSVYFVNESIAYPEIVNNLGRYLLKFQGACLNSNCGDLPIKTCGDNLIVFSDVNESKVWEEGNCTFISGDHLKASDAFLYKIMGIQ